MPGDQDISGYWSGWYDYAGNAAEVPFSAWLDMRADQVSGTTLEPNTFAHPDLTELSADLTGHVSGDRVSFFKTYHPGPEVHTQTIRYEGVISDDATRINGHWIVGESFFQLTGVFEMHRTRLSEAKSAEEEAQEPISILPDNLDHLT